MSLKAHFRRFQAYGCLFAAIIVCHILDSCNQGVTDDFVLQQKQTLSVSEKEEGLCISREYTPQINLQTVLSPCGPNELMGISQLRYLKPDDSLSTLFATTSDWIGPYVLHAIEGNNRRGNFTGGWHAYNGDGTGTPTARLVEKQVFIDGILTEHLWQEQSCSEVVVKAKHLIQADNTKQEDGMGREVLQEDVTYRFSGDTIGIKMEITALEDLVIDNYYGLQSCYGNLVQMYTTEGIETFHTDGYHGTMTRVSKMTCTLPDGRQVVCVLDSIGLGTQNRFNKCDVDTDRQYCFTSPYNKVYYRLVGEVGMPMKRGEKVYWSGFYLFRQAREEE